MSISLANHWLALLCLAVAAVLLAWTGWRRRGLSESLGAIVTAGGLVALGVGGLGLVATDVSIYLALGSLGLLVFLLLTLIVSGFWSEYLGYAVGAALLFGLGGWLLPELHTLARLGLDFATSLEPLEPWWLLLLVLIPALFYYSFRSLAGLGPVRRWIAIGLRCALIVFLAMALAEVHARKPDKNLTVLFLWDRSLSIPPEYQGDKDLREERIRGFINEAVERRGPTHQDDRTGVIVFGRRPRLELPPGAVPELRFRKIQSKVDETYTDIAGALKLALASFPEGTGKRIVLISDGNENLGQAEEQARIAKQNGVQIDVVPIVSARQNQNEVLVERIEVPPVTEKDSRVPMRVVIRSFNPNVVVGNLHLTKTSLEMRKSTKQDSEEPSFESKPILVQQVKVKQGLNVFYFQQPGAKKDDAYIYEAKFVPGHVELHDGRKKEEGLAGDRVENNRASASVLARGQRSVLIIEPNVGDHRLLADRLMAAKSSLKVVSVTPAKLPQDPSQLAIVLSKFDSIILANVPADSLSEEQQKVIRSNTHDQGCGLIMVGGPQGFGAGGWQNTEVEKALPVTMDIKSMKVESKGGLVLMMHASEIAEGNAWQRKIAKLAIEKLSPMDMVGMLYYDHGARGGGHQWHIPFQQVGNRRGGILALVNTMEPGDMPDVDPAFVKAYTELTKADYELGTRHIIFISDGDHWSASPALLKKMKEAKITCTTVCITSHGQDEVKKMAAVARLTGGRAYHIKDPSELPAIYIKETRLVSQSFVHEKQFMPQLLAKIGPAEGLPKPLPPLHGFVRTSKRSSPLVESPIETPRIGENQFPLLAYWHYGLGKSVAFTSDARTQAAGGVFWDRDWAGSDMYAKFWEQTVDWSLRSVETGKHMFLTTEQRDGKIRIIVNVHDENKQPLDNVELRAGITSPGFKERDTRKLDLKEQTTSGVFEAELTAEEVGDYFINIQARWKKDGKEYADSIRAGVNIPYSPEFAEMESNSGLLENLRKMTEGESYPESAATLRRVAQSGEVFRPMPLSHSTLQTLWPWFVFLTALCLLLDVAVRRIAIEPAAVWNRATTVWARLRGQAVEEQQTATLERLRSRQAMVGEAIKKEAATRRFEAPDDAPVPTTAVPTARASADPSRPKAAAPAPAAKKEEEAGDFAARLMKAKKRAMEEREKKKDT